MFEHVVQSSVALLGRTDKDTIKLQITHATFLESSSQYSAALDVLAALRAECGSSVDPWMARIEQTEQRLRSKNVKKRRRERPMSKKQTLTEDDKENIPWVKPYSPSKKQKLVQETGEEIKEIRVDGTNLNQPTVNTSDLVPD